MPNSSVRWITLSATGAIAAIAVTGGLGAGPAHAADKVRVIKGCYSTKTTKLRIVDSSKSCRKGEDQIIWVRGNTQG
ncbi:hypothetical protein, partial [Nocardioides sp.]|uniref:hypothetical protein n=1 Tax=Nocardioides sp. TaxID=35761 RepID=UPI00263752E2